MWSLKESDSYELIQTFSSLSPPKFIVSYSENRSSKKRKTNEERVNLVKLEKLMFLFQVYFLLLLGKNFLFGDLV